MSSHLCIVGGWIEPRGSRPFFGALLLGMHDDEGRLVYVGRTGAGFPDAELGRIWKRLHALRTKRCPFAAGPPAGEKPHWSRPRLVVEIEASGWTARGTLRRPVYVGLRDDVKPDSVRRPPPRRPASATGPSAEPPQAPPDTPGTASARPAGRSRSPAASLRHAAGSTTSAVALAADRRARPPLSRGSVAKLLAQIDAIADRGGDGVLELPDGGTLAVTNSGKVFWPGRTGSRHTGHPLTKGDLLRHYVRVAPFILPALADRPLVMKRYPNGVEAKPFYQHRAPGAVPRGVRVETVATGNERRPHVIGGDLATLLYTAQLASISQDPWFSRVGTEQYLDHVAIDLDPPEGLAFDRVLDVARWVRDELAAMGAAGFAKTSGASGLHVYVPMPPETPYEAGLLFCQILATRVAHKHPALATIERSVSARGRRVYVDYLQNVQGKTLASAYSARASAFAGVSTPLTWEEIDDGPAPQDFTVATFARRLEQVGDLWAGLRKARGANLRGV